VSRILTLGCDNFCTVRDRISVAIHACWLSIGTDLGNLEWPWTA